MANIQRILGVAFSIFLIGTILILSTARLKAEESCYVYFDVGHSPPSSGSSGVVSVTGEVEYEYNRKLASYLASNLEYPTGTQIAIGPFSLKDRVWMANSKEMGGQPDVFISIHHDSAQEKYLDKLDNGGWKVKEEYENFIRGFSIFVVEGEEGERIDRSKNLALTLGMVMVSYGYVPSTYHVEDIPGENKKPITSFGILFGAYYAPLYVLRHTEMPAILIEAEVIVNEKGEKLAKDPSYHREIAQAIDDALELTNCGRR